ncbi:MAG: GTPase ObgE [bacterium]|nr:GTPase ObgE [bacterium]
MVDLVKLLVQAGDGGDGCVSFQRHRYQRYRQSDGGDGGDGGQVYLVGDANLSTLIDFRSRHIFKAGAGQRGGSNKKKGANGKDIFLRVPLGTIVTNEAGKSILADIKTASQPLLLARRGDGGKGNAHFKRGHSTKGILGETFKGQLEVQLIADFGLIGLPSAGKTTLLNALTSAHGKVGNYPFTTLEPNLGVTSEGLVVADIPGLIAGASEGKGLGDEFLRHVKRTRGLIHLVAYDEAMSETAPVKLWENYSVVQTELEKYNPSLIHRPQIIVLNKADLISDLIVLRKIKAFFSKKGLQVFPISAKNKSNLSPLKRQMTKWHQEAEIREVGVSEPKVAFGVDDLPGKNLVFSTPWR